MYKYIKDGAEITWIPMDKNLGIQIVSEVTNQRKADKNGYVEVTEEERIRIQELYEERNTDPKEEPKEEKPKEDMVLTLMNAQAESFEKSEKDKMDIMNAIAECYEMNLKEV